MIYAVSDIHGRYEKYRAAAEMLAPDDTLYILGDVVDRGRDGLKILLDMKKRKNVIGLMGNHECLGIICLPLLVRILNERSSDGLTEGELRTFAEWAADGGCAAAAEFAELSAEDRQNAFLAMSGLLPYAEVNAGGKDFVLVHAGLSGFSPERKLSDYSPDELLFSRPDLEKTYFEDKYLVFGHTPTRILRKKLPDGKGQDEIYEHGKLIGIDCACAYGGKLGVLCLDTLEKTYL